MTFELTRLHALIGPNDSGKSTVLSALCTAGKAGAAGGVRLDPRAGKDVIVELTPSTDTLEQAAVRGATLVRWDPDAMRQPCDLIPEGKPFTIGEKGDGLAAVYEVLLSQDRPTFDAIEDGVRRHFSTVKSIWLPTAAGSKKALGVILHDGTRVQADAMSEGLLYWLAFSALPHISPTAFLLVEEPENGLHPARIAEVMKVLRAISRRTQVVLATHSPLVINELQPTEVTLLTRDDRTGTVATRMDRTKNFRPRQKVYALGELWLSFGDGNDEAALVGNKAEDPAS
jgi:predicted ATPase